MAKHEEVKNGIIFPIGEKNDAYAQYFVGLANEEFNKWEEGWRGVNKGVISSTDK